MGILSALTCCSCVFIVIINILGIIISLCITALGGILLWGIPLAKNFIGVALKNIEKTIPNSQGGVDLTKTFTEMFTYMRGAGIAILITGLILFVICIIGCCGACCKVKVLLVVYSIIVSIVFLAFLIVVIILFTKGEMFLNPTKEAIKKQIATDYKSFNNMNAFTLLMSFIQAFLHCCGVDSGEDYKQAKNWDNQYTIKKSGYTANVTLQYPITCCKMEKFVPIDYNCTTNPTVINSNFKSGCMKKFTDFIAKTIKNPTMGAFSGFVAALALLTLMAIIMTIGVYNERKVTPI